MAEFISKHLTVIALSAGAVSMSAALGYYFGVKKNDSKSSKRMKSLFNEDDQLVSYILQSSLREPSFLRNLRDETRAKTKDDIKMIVDPIEAQFLRLLLSTYGARRCIEVGTFTGYNACSVALSLPEDGEVIACDISEDFINIGKPFWPEECSKKIKVNIGPAVETLDRLIEEGQSGTFDFVFIDADKSNYGRYYERALVLLKEGGIIAVDNTLWSGRVLEDPSTFDESTKAISELNRKIKNDERVEIAMLQLGDGTTICRKK